MQKILLVEDDEQIVEHLSTLLAEEHFVVRTAMGQREAMRHLEQEPFDLVLLDVSLPDGNGFAVCTAVRERWQQTPVIFLTASGDEYSVVAGLDMGAEDYVQKPFRPRELISRIRTVLRRNQKEDKSGCLQCQDIQVNLVTAAATKGGRELFLSALEYRLLLLFMQNQGVTLTRNRILEEIWDASGEYVNDNTLSVYMKRLREKIETDPARPKLLHTIRGIGYRMEAIDGKENG